MRKFNYYSLNYYYETYYLAHAKLVVKLWKKNILMILNIYKALYNMFCFCLPVFRDVGLGDVVTVGQCRPLSKTVRFNVLKVSKGKGSKDKKQFEKF